MLKLRAAVRYQGRATVRAKRSSPGYGKGKIKVEIEMCELASARARTSNSGSELIREKESSC